MDDFFKPQVIDLSKKAKARVAQKAKGPKPPPPPGGAKRKASSAPKKTIQERLEEKVIDGVCTGCSLCKVKRHATNPPPPGHKFDGDFIYANREENGVGNKNSNIIFLVERMDHKVDLLISYLKKIHQMDENDYFIYPALQCKSLEGQKMTEAVAPFIACNLLHVGKLLKEVSAKVTIAFGRAIYSLTKEKDINGTKAVFEPLYNREFRTNILPVPDINYMIDKRGEDYYFQDNWYRHILDVHINNYKAQKFSVYPEIETKDIISASEEHAIQILQDVLEKTKDVFAYDTETGGFNYLEDKLGGVSLCYKEEIAYYIQWNHIKANTVAKNLLNSLFVEKESVAHNGKFDEKFLKSGGKGFLGLTGIENVTTTWDTMLMHHIVRADQKHGLKLLAYLYTGYGGYDIELDRYKKDFKINSYLDIPIDILGRYACMDARVTLLAFRKLKAIIDADESMKFLLEQISMPLSRAFTEIEMKGIRVDQKYLEEYAASLKQKKIDLENRCYQTVGKTFNINSTKDLREIVKELKMPKVKETAGGSVSTDKEAMATWAKQGYPFAQSYQEWSIVNTKLKTFVGDPDSKNTDDKKGLWKFIQKDGRIHCGFLISGTETGRISCLDPNLMNQPKDEDYRRVYQCPPGYKFIEADFSQAELRVAAVFADDKAMKENFALGRDIHCTTVCKMRPEWDYEYVNANKGNNDTEVPKMRKKAKTVNFGVIYGESAYSLSDQLGITQDEAEEFLKQYFKAFSGLSAWRDQTQDFTRKNAITQTLWGRKRQFKELEYPIGMSLRKLGGYERQALNTPVQGSSSDYVLLSLVKVHEMLKKNQFKTRIVGTVHDSIVLEAAEEEIPIVAPMIKEIMETAADIGVPMVADIEVGSIWGFPE
jgi:DNA polymerase I-like protein with 3'-5' exonuclease and polymerase domains